MNGRTRTARLACALVASLALVGCGGLQSGAIGTANEQVDAVRDGQDEQDEARPGDGAADEASDEDAPDETTTKGGTSMARISITVNGRSFEAQLEDSDCGRAFAAQLPLELAMSELNGNEKYCYTGTELPSSPTNPGRIEAGDLMLYGSDCVVLFYQSFETSYRYTRIGRITDPTGIAEAVGSGTATVAFASAA